MYYLQYAKSKNIASPPSWLVGSVQYEVITGSQAYGMAVESSDLDIYGWAIPSKEVVFPHLGGEIQGFGRPKKRFEQYLQHGCVMENKKELDFTFYNIVKLFHLMMNANPNVLEVLWVPPNCVTLCSDLGRLVRDNRKIFLSKKTKHTYSGYAFSQIHKMKSKTFKNSKRKEEVEKYGFSLKFASHAVRLILQGIFILQEEYLDLQTHKEILKSIRRGEWTIEEIETYVKEKEKEIDKLYISSTLQHSPDEDEIKNLLLNVLEQYYGSIEKAIVRNNELEEQVKKIIEVTNKIKERKLV